jgi:hypothetical protein
VRQAKLTCGYEVRISSNSARRTNRSSDSSLTSESVYVGQELPSHYHKTSSGSSGTLIGSSEFSNGSQYCESCDIHFESRDALKTHHKDSPCHNLCAQCPHDATTWAGLLEHYKQSGHRLVCMQCDGGKGLTYSNVGDSYQKHFSEQHVCMTCLQHCTSARDLLSVSVHLLFHVSKDIRMFFLSKSVTSFQLNLMYPILLAV